MSTVLQFKHNRTPTKTINLVGSDAKNTLPSGITALDIVGLTWTLHDEYSDLRKDC